VERGCFTVCAGPSGLQASPYYETFKRHQKEVIFVYNAIDDFVMDNLRKYHGR
jgi:HSP90 family molecular chaperone